MRINLKTKGIMKKIALVLACIMAVTGVGFGVKAVVDYTKNDLKKITPVFEVGNLGTDGKYVNDESTLYTKEAFGCYGLQVKPDFDSTVNYQIFYYDILDNFISSTSVLSEGYSEKAPVHGAYARMVITPKEDEDDKISFTEKYKYPTKLTIKVKKNQNIDSRFGFYKGKILDVVEETDSLVFTGGITISTSTLNWQNDNHYCATTSVVLKVSGGMTLKRDFSKLGESLSGSYCRVFEFKDMPLEDNLIVHASDYDVSSTYVLDKKTNYILITVEAPSTSATWSDTVLAKLPSCFTLQKTK